MMRRQPFTTLTSTIVVLPGENVDTDQIIPARYLTTTTSEGLGAALFSDWRYDAPGHERSDFVLNRSDVRDARILVAHRNFGCGSSREHAAWALLGYGFRAVISSSFADIFRTNALTNGLVAITVDEAAHDELVSSFAGDPLALVTIDLPAQQVILPSGRQAHFPIDPFSKHCLEQGIDALEFILAERSAIDAYEATHSPRVETV
jgi:3-isopropylmalate/(R)-2-methylmalate dehydratase small subunit